MVMPRATSSETSRRMVFTCRPTNAKEEETCAADIVKGLTARAFRGDATPDDVQDALGFYEKGRKSGDFEWCPTGDQIATWHHGWLTQVA